MTTAFLASSEAAAPCVDVFDDSHYASSFTRKLWRTLQLGPRYYLFDLPRYFAGRRALGLPGWDLAAFTNPLREFRRRTLNAAPLPVGYVDAIQRLGDAGVRLTIPRGRLEALLGAWWSVRDIGGDVMECGAYRGATSLLIGLLGHMNGISQKIFLLDTLNGMPPTSTFDSARSPGEFKPDENQVECIVRQASALGIASRIEIHQGLFADTFANLRHNPLRLSFVHVDANIYESTLQACRFAVPRVQPGGAVVFDDYNGVCDLGARLAIQQYLVGRLESLAPLTGSSELLRV